jgi:shikimate dehydrogenase
MPAPATEVVVCGSLSRHPVTLGMAMHESGYRALGLRWRYVPFRCLDLRGALTGMRALGIRGFGVSVPFKLDVVPLCDALDPVAARIGAVNTVVNTEGVLVGHNTDWLGAVRALEEVRPLGDVPVLLLGAGGAGRAVAHGLVEAGAVLSIANRTPERAEALAAETGARAVPWHERDALVASGAVAVVVNATSAGMRREGGSPLADASLGPGLVVMDIVYDPLGTALIIAARERGATVVHGGRMLLHQAARQLELYTSLAAPLEAMDAALRDAIGDLA